MSFTHTHTDQITGSSGVNTKTTSNEIGNVGVSAGPGGKVFAAGLTDQLWSVAFSHATLQSLFLMSDKDCTVKTNSAGSPANTLNLKAGLPLKWRASDGYFPNPLSADVTALYVTTGSSATTIYLEVLTN